MTDKKTVLGFECGSLGCSAAVIEGDIVLAMRSSPATRGQAEILMPMIEGVLHDAGVTWGGLSLFGVAVGPGSFTSLRIGLSVARALALTGLKGIGVAATEVAAKSIDIQSSEGLTVLGVIDGKRDDLFVQAFGPDLVPLGEIDALMPEDIAARYPGRLLLAGDGAVRALPFCPGALLSGAAGGAEVVARLTLEKDESGGGLPLVPLYLRAPDVTVAGL